MHSHEENYYSNVLIRYFVKQHNGEYVPDLITGLLSRVDYWTRVRGHSDAKSCFHLHECAFTIYFLE